MEWLEFVHDNRVQRNFRVKSIPTSTSCTRKTASAFSFGVVAKSTFSPDSTSSLSATSFQCKAESVPESNVHSLPSFQPCCCMQQQRFFFQVRCQRIASVKSCIDGSIRILFLLLLLPCFDVPVAPFRNIPFVCSHFSTATAAIPWLSQAPAAFSDVALPISICEAMSPAVAPRLVSVQPALTYRSHSSHCCTTAMRSVNLLY